MQIPFILSMVEKSFGRKMDVRIVIKETYLLSTSYFLFLGPRMASAVKGFSGQ